MAITKQFGNLASPPSDYFEFGEGSFTLWYHNTTLGGDIDEPSSSGILTTHDTTYAQWAIVPPGGSWKKGNGTSVFVPNVNDNDLTLTYPSSTMGTDTTLVPTFIKSLYIKYICTATSGTRLIRFEIKPFGLGSSVAIDAYKLTASQTLILMLGKNGNMAVNDLGSNNLTSVMPMGIPQPFGGTIRIFDDSDVDSNDDIYVQSNGYDGVHKFAKLDFHNCKNFGTTYVGSAGYQYSSNGRNQVAWVSKYGDDQPIDPKVWVNK